MKNLRTATAKDFKIGTTLIMKEGGYAFTIYNEYDEGIWEARGNSGQGDKVVYEGAAQHYQVEEEVSDETITIPE